MTRGNVCPEGGLERPGNGCVLPSVRNVSMCGGVHFRMSALNDNLEQIVIKYKFMCLTHSEAKQYEKVGLWSRESLL